MEHVHNVYVWDGMQLHQVPFVIKGNSETSLFGKCFTSLFGKCNFLTLISRAVKVAFSVNIFPVHVKLI